jgi:hypothetical protein
MTRRRIGFVVLAVVAIDAAIWAGVIAGGLVAYHHLTR